jgi:hypothetical protein
MHPRKFAWQAGREERNLTSMHKFIRPVDSANRPDLPEARCSTESAVEYSMRKLMAGRKS